MAIRPTTTSLPQAFLERMERLLGNEFLDFLNSYLQPPTTGLRVNPLKITNEAFSALSPFSLSPIPWCPTGFLVQGEATPGKHPYHAAGLYYLQEPSAMAVVELLDPQPGERVLDLSAAPGGKATHIAALMNSQGLLVANEIHPRRVWELAENLERWGATNVIITNENPQRLADHLEGFFDKVLLDAPCSGEGMFRKSETARVEWSPEAVESCAIRQASLLDEAARLVRPGGRLAYSTCTFAPQENEGAITRFLETHPKFELVAPARAAEFSPGRPDWVRTVKAGKDHPSGEDRPSAVAKIPYSSLSHTIRLWPHRLSGEGHFIALLQKPQSRSSREMPAWRPGPAPKQAQKLFNTFCQANLSPEALAHKFSEAFLFLKGTYLYQLPSELPDLDHLKVIHPGWWLGTVKKDRFEPSQALAMGLYSTDAKRFFPLDAQGPETGEENGDSRWEHSLAYLRGQTFSSNGDDGWILIGVNQYPLGWGKRSKGQIKNFYPHGLRR